MIFFISLIVTSILRDVNRHEKGSTFHCLIQNGKALPEIRQGLLVHADIFFVLQQQIDQIHPEVLYVRIGRIFRFPVTLDRISV